MCGLWPKRKKTTRKEPENYFDRWPDDVSYRHFSCSLALICLDYSHSGGAEITILPRVFWSLFSVKKKNSVKSKKYLEFVCCGLSFFDLTRILFCKQDMYTTAFSLTLKIFLWMKSRRVRVVYSEWSQKTRLHRVDYYYVLMMYLKIRIVRIRNFR